MCQPDGDLIKSVRKWIADGVDVEEDLWPVELETPTAEWIVSQFWELHATRGGGYGPGPISYQELKAYIELTGIDLSPWVIEQIRMLDRMYLSAYATMVREQADK